MKNELIEGPRIPRSCDPNWGFRDESGNLKEGYSIYLGNGLWCSSEAYNDMLNWDNEGEA